MGASKAAFDEIAPFGRTSPIVVSSPHSGSAYPDDLLAALAVPPERLRCLEDGPTDALAAGCAAVGATVLAARFARAYVDLNRAPLEIDRGLLGEGARAGRVIASAKVLAGLGIVPSRLGTLALYRQPPGAASLRARLEHAYLPYHRRLRELLRERITRCGAALLIDCHSMPVEAAGSGRAAIDVAVGDRFGESCDRRLVAVAEDTLAAHGLKVARNRPYAGGFITEHHGRPAEDRHAIQLEIRRDLFMEPETHRLTVGAERIAEALIDVVRAIGARLATLGPIRRLPPTGTVELAVPELLRAAD